MSAAPYVVEAFNTATESENRIHDDEVASSLGFGGGLVPGVDVYAYLTHVPVERWGRDWLERGTAALLLRRPVYDGEGVEVDSVPVDSGLEATATTEASGVCASLRCGMTSPDEPLPDVPHVDPPSSPPRASDETLAPGTVLGALDFTFDPARADGYLDDVRETLSFYRDERVCHPGYLLRWANWSLSHNVRLGPWIHTSSRVRHLACVEAGDHVEVRGRVVDNTERRGHRFVRLDVVYLVGDQPVMVVDHEAIWRPRDAS